MQADVRVDAAADRSLKSKIDFFATAIKTNEEKKLQSVDQNKKAPTDVYQIKKAGDILVGAIDFGTTYSGWGFQTDADFKLDPTKSYIKLWMSSTAPATEKTPTVVLIKPDGKTLDSFGYEAEERYAELAANKEHEKYFYFRRFKMALYKKLGEKMDIHMTLEDERGRTLPAFDVFSLAIKYLFDDMYKEINERILGSVEQCEIPCVITVPAIWTPSAKEFMQRVGKNAGIPPDKLIIALEPEAASIFCRHLQIEKKLDTTGVSIASFPSGTRYIVLDAGGGTVDIAVHEVAGEHSKLKEVKAASGGGWGGIRVDEAFEKLITDIVGLNVYSTFKDEETEDWLDLMHNFEVKKKKVDPGNAKIVMSIPVSLVEIYKKKTGKSLTAAVESSNFRTDVKFSQKNFKMTFEANVSKDLFDFSISKIIQHVESLCRDQGVGQIKAILMVGGFSASPMLQKAVKSHLKDVIKNIISPCEASSSIMRGALIFGHCEKRNEKTILQRVLDHTFGFETAGLFVEGEHPENRRMETDKGVRCKNVFSKHVETDQVVEVGEPQKEQAYLPLYRTQTKMSFPLYASKLKDPKYIDEDDCIYVGKMIVKLPDLDGDLDREVLVWLTFSGTVIEVSALDVKRKEKTKAWFEFSG